MNHTSDLQYTTSKTHEDDSNSELTTNQIELTSNSPSSSHQNPQTCITNGPGHFHNDLVLPAVVPGCSSAATPISFSSTTIAPSPPTEPMSIDSPKLLGRSSLELASSSLRISTSITSPISTSPSLAHRESPTDNIGLSPTRVSGPLNRKASANSLRHLNRTPSLKAALSGSLGTASGTSSVISSPMINAMGDVTPLPSPIMLSDSPGPWRKLTIGSVSPPMPRARLSSVGEGSVLVTSAGESINTAAMAATRRKVYTSLNDNTERGHVLPKPSHQPQNHSRNRSLSEYTPEPATVSQRPVSVSGSHAKVDSEESHMRREQNLAESRGLAPSMTQPPTPPPSESSKDSTDGATAPSHEFFEAHDRNDNKRRRWRSICTVGQGTFSRVVLATSQLDVPEDLVSDSQPGNPAAVADPRLDRKTLVAIKVCEHGPQGGASEERVEMSLKRELEIMQSIHHPSLVNLKAWSIEPTRAILVLTYCPGGDLFDVATTHRHLLTPSLTRRIFSELVGAVKYLHEQMVVHRDIKLENVLVNLTADELANSSIDWATYPYSVIALADLGLSRRIAEDEKLETRCGSEDYAAPEVIMGQPYDGRATDAWSLGVLLYSLLESRLPFDPPPGMSDSHRMRSRKSHRIARVEWRWIEYEGSNGDHDGSEAKFSENGLLGAMHITEGLLKRARSRWTMAQVSAEPWVRDAVNIEGGLRFREEAEGAEV